MDPVVSKILQKKSAVSIYKPHPFKILKGLIANSIIPHSKST